MDPELTIAQLLQQLRGNRQRAVQTHNRYREDLDTDEAGTALIDVLVNAPLNRQRHYRQNAFRRATLSGEDYDEAREGAERLARTVNPVAETGETDGLMNALGFLAPIAGFFSKRDPRVPEGGQSFRELEDVFINQFHRAGDTRHQISTDPRGSVHDMMLRSKIRSNALHRNKVTGNPQPFEDVKKQADDYAARINPRREYSVAGENQRIASEFGMIARLLGGG